MRRDSLIIRGNMHTPPRSRALSLALGLGLCLAPQAAEASFLDALGNLYEQGSSKLSELFQAGKEKAGPAIQTGLEKTKDALGSAKEAVDPLLDKGKQKVKDLFQGKKSSSSEASGNLEGLLTQVEAAQEEVAERADAYRSNLSELGPSGPGPNTRAFLEQRWNRLETSHKTLETLYARLLPEVQEARRLDKLSKSQLERIGSLQRQQQILAASMQGLRANPLGTSGTTMASASRASSAGDEDRATATTTSSAAEPSGSTAPTASSTGEDDSSRIVPQETVTPTPEPSPAPQAPEAATQVVSSDNSPTPEPTPEPATSDQSGTVTFTSTVEDFNALPVYNFDPETQGAFIEEWLQAVELDSQGRWTDPVTLEPRGGVTQLPGESLHSALWRNYRMWDAGSTLTLEAYVSARTRGYQPKVQRLRHPDGSPLQERVGSPDKTIVYSHAPSPTSQEAAQGGSEGQGRLPDRLDRERYQALLRALRSGDQSAIEKAHKAMPSSQ